jgi:Spy/CpxP family protein refolding chaperone
MTMRRTLTLAMAIGLLLALSATAAVAAPPPNANANAADHFRAGAVYADGELFDTLILTDAIKVHDGNRHSTSTP